MFEEGEGNMTKKYVTFGELMLRLSPAGHEVLFQTPRLEATFGGAEANVAVSLANYGESVDFVTALPRNPVADAAIRELRAFGVGTSRIARKGERVGIYYAETGASMRQSKVVYDRAHSSISEISPDEFKWDDIFKDAHWFHTTGITPALSRNAAEATLEAMKAARAHGVKISCDLNYRKKLWKWGRSPEEVMTELASQVDVLIANEEDCQKCLGIELDIDVTKGSIDASKYRELARRVTARFPNVERFAVSLRESLSADWNNWSVVMADKNGFYTSKKYEIRDIVDRIGGGDSFGAGLIWGLDNLGGPLETVEFAAAASALKHTIYGDYNMISLDDVKNLAAGDASGRVQR
ncbi:MAG: sugar kinase [Synergistaceae bacterium]|jgi:2-dehydro-3-deoxygluconokinase|nr:sugar kinase [Synergistaceae bacterium]